MADDTRTRREAVLPDRNLALELVRVTEAAALAAGSLGGNGRKEPRRQCGRRIDAQSHLVRRHGRRGCHW